MVVGIKGNEKKELLTFLKGLIGREKALVPLLLEVKGTRPRALDTLLEKPETLDALRTAQATAELANRPSSTVYFRTLIEKHDPALAAEKGEGRG